MPRRNPKPIGKALASKYARLRRWGRCWKEDPERMERARRKNVAKAHDYYRGLNDGLKDHVSAWPSSMTSKEFVGLLMASVPLLGRGRTRKGYDWKSFRSRLVRLGFCTFDSVTRLWTNHCKPSVDNSPSIGTNVGE